MYFVFKIEKPPRITARGFLMSPKDKGSKVLGDQEFSRVQGLTCEDGRGIVGVPVVAEQTAAPVPPEVAPVEVTNHDVADGVVIDRSPEGGVLVFPTLRNEFRVGQQVVQHVGVQGGLIREFLAQVAAHDDATVLLTFVQVELDPLGIPLQLTALLVALHIPAIGDEGVGVAVDHVLDDLDRVEWEVGIGEEFENPPPLLILLACEPIGPANNFVGLAARELLSLTHDRVLSGVHRTPY